MNHALETYLHNSLMSFLISVAREGYYVAEIFLVCLPEQLNNLLSRFKTIHFRHLKIHEDEFVRFIITITSLETLLEHEICLIPIE